MRDRPWKCEWEIRQARAWRAAAFARRRRIAGEALAVCAGLVALGLAIFLIVAGGLTAW